MIEERRTCIGCGATIQYHHPEKIGYIPITKKDESADEQLCQRCFRIRHYHELLPVDQDESDYLQLLSNIAHSDSLVVQVIDLFDFEGSLIPGIHRHIGKNDLYLLANKVDLFPKSVKHTKLISWVERSAKEKGMFPIGIGLCSAYKGWYMDQVMKEIHTLRKGRDVFVVGTANVGKSTFINRLLGDHRITTSRYPGTTLATIRIPFEDSRAMFDTPGVLRKDRLSEWLTPKELKWVLPDKPLKPKVYQLYDQQTLFLGGLSRIDYVEGEKQPFVCYVSNRLSIHRTKRSKADDVQNKHLGTMLVPPLKTNHQLPEWTKHRIALSGDQYEDVIIAGLGFIRCGKKRALIDMWVPRGIQIGTRSSII